MEHFVATVGRGVEIPMWFGVTAGLTLATIDTIQALDGVEILDLEDDLGGELTEISGVPGYYLLTIIPRRAGALYLKMVEGAVTNEFKIQSTLSVPPLVADTSLEGELVVHAQVGSVNVPGVTVRVYDSAGTTLVARGLTDSGGLMSFPLEVGSYEVRMSKVGYDFSSINPTTVVVLPNDNVTPLLEEILPDSASIGDMITLVGQFFHLEDSEVLFGAAPAEPVLFVNATGRVLMVEIPAGLTDLAIPVRIRKPDPDDPGSYLLSNVVTLTRIP